MDAYCLPWFDPAEAAEARLDALAEESRAGADTLIEGGQASRDLLECDCSDALPGRFGVAPTHNPVDSLGHPWPCRASEQSRLAGGVLFV